MGRKLAIVVTSGVAIGLLAAIGYVANLSLQRSAPEAITSETAAPPPMSTPTSVPTPRPLPNAVAVTRVASATLEDPYDPNLAKVYAVRVDGTMTNNFGERDAWCNSGLFKLIGNSRTYEPEFDISKGCQSFEVAPGTKTDFEFGFNVKKPGQYTLRFQREVPGKGPQGYETHSIAVR